ncbi:tetratricopeptide repeat protein [Endozoicomonadaceae bacterium StTr2]
MMQMSHVIEVTAENFRAEVLEKSQTVPVLLDIWADWCEPCKQQLPILMKLVEAYQGKFILAKLDAEAQQGLAHQLMQQLGVRSIPTLIFLDKGQVAMNADRQPIVLAGVQQESDLRQILDELTMSPAEKVKAEIDLLLENGQTEEALQLLQHILAQEPENNALQVLQAELLLKLGRTDQARMILDALPADLAEAAGPRSRLAFVDQMGDAEPREVLEGRLEANEKDHEARYQLAMYQVLANEAEAALESLLFIIRVDREFRDDGARKLMLQIFSQLEKGDPLIKRYRNRLFSLMH